MGFSMKWNLRPDDSFRGTMSHFLVKRYRAAFHIDNSVCFRNTHLFFIGGATFRSNQFRCDRHLLTTISCTPSIEDPTTKYRDFCNKLTREILTSTLACKFHNWAVDLQIKRHRFLTQISKKVASDTRDSI